MKKNTILTIFISVLSVLTLISMGEAETAAACNDFIIEKDGSLTGYVGNSKKVIIPDGVVEIAEGAFEKNEKITSVVIPDSVQHIGYHAFARNPWLVDLIVPKTVENIDATAFNDTPWFDRIIAENDTYMLNGCLMYSADGMTV